MKGSPKFYADAPEVVESEIERLIEIIKQENATESAKTAQYSGKAEQIRTPPLRHAKAVATAAVFLMKAFFGKKFVRKIKKLLQSTLQNGEGVVRYKYNSIELRRRSWIGRDMAR